VSGHVSFIYYFDFSGSAIQVFCRAAGLSGEIPTVVPEAANDVLPLKLKERPAELTTLSV
jgi:hypothetical protein